MRRRAARALVVAFLLAPAVFLLLDRAFPFPLESIHRPAAVAVLDREGEPLRFFLPPDERWRLPVSHEEIPDELVEALLASEDRWFRHHPGVNPLAVLRATWQNLRAGRVVSGGSTLTMQIARMAHPAPRTLRAKLREAFRALQLERRYDKDELIEIYLNMAPFGGNLEGIGAASYFYFGKRPDQLSIGEIAMLVTLPRSPTRYDPTRDAATARRVRDRVLSQIEARGAITRREVADAVRHPVPAERRKVPFAAPHFARWARDADPTAERIATTLDASVQRRAEEQVRRRMAELRAGGVGNAAAIVLDRATREIRAMVGSGDFFDEDSDGQVNGTLARRSPGSTLKPFLYALALDRGEIVADSYLLDLPTDYAGYVAENYDGEYRGRVTARTALVHSLNAPAVRLLARVGVVPFLRLLRQGGLETLDRPSAEYGLPLVLGAGEVTLLDLTNLYATLAEGGLHRDPAWRAGRRQSTDSPESMTMRILSPEAAWSVTEMLLEVRRPDMPQSWRQARDAPGVAWKTGTSYGHRDAWAVGFSGRFAIGVWVGNFDGKPRHGISGAEHAAPVLFDLFRALEPSGSKVARPRGLTLDRLEVCALSRQLLGPHCDGRETVTILRERSRLTPCAYHRRTRATSTASRGWRKVTVYPSELMAWWLQRGEPLPRMALSSAPAPGTSAIGTAAGRPGRAARVPSGSPPRIVSPSAATPYRLRSGAPLEHQRIPLIAHVAADVSRLYWYQGGALVASGAPGERLFLNSERGRHRLVVTDDLGRSGSLTVVVE